MITSLPPRFWEKVDLSGPNGCWQWLAGVNRSGYGRFFLDGGQMAHRLAYIDQRGPIGAGLVIDHLCRNRRCVNPSHMEPVDIKTNTLRGYGACAMHARKTHCVNGHAFSSENTRIEPDGSRRCKACQRKATADYAARRRRQVAN